MVSMMRSRARKRESLVPTSCVLMAVLHVGALPHPCPTPLAPVRWLPGADCGGLARTSRIRLRLRGGLASSSDVGESYSDDEDSEGGMRDSSSQPDSTSGGSMDAVAGAHPAETDEQAGEDGPDKTKKRRQKRGPKGDPTGKRKHRGRRGGKLAKAAREKRAAVPLSDDALDENVRVAATIAEIAAAAPHVAEIAEPSPDADPAMRFINPSEFDGLDDIKRSTLYDERHDLLDIGPEFSARLCGTAPPETWMRTWFPHAASSAASAGSSCDPALPPWANRTLDAASKVLAAYNNLSHTIAAASDPFALVLADVSPAHAFAAINRSWLHAPQGALLVSV